MTRAPRTWRCARDKRQPRAQRHVRGACVILLQKQSPVISQKVGH